MSTLNPNPQLRVHSGYDAGMTLLELAIVLAIISSVFAMAVPSLRRSHAQPTLDAAAGRLAAALRGAHAQAIRINEDQFVVVDPQHSSFGGRSVAVLDRLPGGVGLHIKRDGLEWEGEHRLVRFRPDGTASGGVFALTDSAGRETHVSLDPLTGHVRIVLERR
jgi:prepilin-type N-terminal cleavage/methylation domain-containing protein